MNLPEHGSKDVSSILALELEQEPVQSINGIHKVESDSHTYWLIDVEFSGFTMSAEEILHVHTGTGTRIFLAGYTRGGSDCRFDFQYGCGTNCAAANCF
ncbi:hypothetical protein ACIFQM_12345 [Paenibacillus sp. NRS-1782]|uniref:hypothetical protein n=1 Tax=unclassified Paenibacillus TaxID=185978 RepID=UPI003D2D40FD